MDRLMTTVFLEPLNIEMGEKRCNDKLRSSVIPKNIRNEIQLSIHFTSLNLTFESCLMSLGIIIFIHSAQ